jgi:uncharacterized FlaG/YvyC family protein/predicted lipoprotein with Yx(FWY)xxD motif
MKIYLNTSYSVILVLALIGCGGGSSGNPVSTVKKDDPNVSSNTQITGKAVDGYLNQSIVCLDLSLDGYCQIASEPTANTDVNGSYTLTLTDIHKNHTNFDKAAILVYDGFDTSTNKRFEGKLQAPNDGEAINVTPMSTILHKTVEKQSKDSDLTKVQIKAKIEESKTKLQKIFKLDGIDLGADPIALSDSSLLEASLALQKSVQTMAKANNVNSTKSESDLTEEIFEALVYGFEDIDVSDSEQLGIDSLIDKTVKNNTANGLLGQNAISVKDNAKKIAKKVKDLYKFAKDENKGDIQSLIDQDLEDMKKEFENNNFNTNVDFDVDGNSAIAKTKAELRIDSLNRELKSLGIDVSEINKIVAKLDLNIKIENLYEEKVYTTFKSDDVLDPLYSKIISKIALWDDEELIKTRVSNGKFLANMYGLNIYQRLNNYTIDDKIVIHYENGLINVDKEKSLLNLTTTKVKDAKNRTEVFAHIKEGTNKVILGVKPTLFGENGSDAYVDLVTNSIDASYIGDDFNSTKLLRKDNLRAFFLLLITENSISAYVGLTDSINDYTKTLSKILEYKRENNRDILGQKLFPIIKLNDDKTIVTFSVKDESGTLLGSEIEHTLASSGIKLNNNFSLIKSRSRINDKNDGSSSDQTKATIFGLTTGTSANNTNISSEEKVSYESLGLIEAFNHVWEKRSGSEKYDNSTVSKDGNSNIILKTNKVANADSRAEFRTILNTPVTSARAGIKFTKYQNNNQERAGLIIKNKNISLSEKIGNLSSNENLTLFATLTQRGDGTFYAYAEIYDNNNNSYEITSKNASINKDSNYLNKKLNFQISTLSNTLVMKIFEDNETQIPGEIVITLPSEITSTNEIDEITVRNRLRDDATSTDSEAIFYGLSTNGSHITTTSF